MSMNVSSIEMFNILRAKLGDNEARILTEYIEEKVEKSIEKEKAHIASKKDLIEVKVELIKWMFGFWVTLVLLIISTMFLKP